MLEALLDRAQTKPTSTTEFVAVIVAECKQRCVKAANMKTPTRSTAILLSTLLLFPATVATQTPAIKTAKAAKKQLTLNEVLGCSDDEWLVAAWKASLSDMMSRIFIYVYGKKKDKQQTEISSFPFVTSIADGTEHDFVLMRDASNDKTNEKKFCHSHVIAHYEDEGFTTKPLVIDIYVDDDQWTFDFSQVLRHADQFAWKTGVFSNSAESYLSVTKGNCTLQFLVSTGVAKLYRVIYEK